MVKGTRGEGIEIYFLRKHLHAPRVEEYGKEIQKKFGERAVDLQKYKRQGEPLLVGSFNSRIGKASNPK